VDTTQDEVQGGYVLVFATLDCVQSQLDVFLQE